jgi:hypothetical protein
MNQQQQARRTRRRAFQALLCKEVSRYAYGRLLTGEYEIVQDILYARHKTTDARYNTRLKLRKLETPRAKAQRKLDEDIDQILGLRKPPSYAEQKAMNYASAYSGIGAGWGLAIQRPQYLNITGTV